MFTLKKALLSNCGAVIEMSRSRAVEMKRKATLVLRLVRKLRGAVWDWDLGLGHVMGKDLPVDLFPSGRD